MRRNIVVGLGIVAILLVVLSPLCTAEEEVSENTPPTITGRVTPAQTYGGSEFLFTATYRDADNDSAAFVRVVLDGVSYDMQEIKSSETNFSAGKEYYFRKRIAEGPAMFYFTTSDGNTTVSTSTQTLFAEPVGIFTGEHQDITRFTALVTPFFLGAIVLLLLQIRGLKKVVEKYVSSHPENGAPNNEDQKGDQNL